MFSNGNIPVRNNIAETLAKEINFEYNTRNRMMNKTIFLSTQNEEVKKEDGL